MLADISIRFQPEKYKKIRYYVTNYSIICHKSTNFQCTNNGYYAKSHIVQAMNLKQDDSRLPKTS